MSINGALLVSDAQYRDIHAGLRVVRAWAEADDYPEAALDEALQREDGPAGTAIGLATVARLLAIELAAASGRTEIAVLDDLAATMHRLQYPLSRAPK
ncbi:hypothetical protein [Microbacterium sp. NPDC058345]|uniref:hypothetical protein n=1 Tax=Microbacterium sp. NPDC058345 TaxID=3346455 RepID=UPI003659ED2C